MTPERRLALVERLYWTARTMKPAWLRAQHADWSEEQMAREVTRIFSVESQRDSITQPGVAAKRLRRENNTAVDQS